MTKEEAIKGLKVLRRDFSGYKPNEEMFDMAIKALEQEPCEDAVSRQAIDELSIELVHTTRDKADFLRNFWEGLRKLPPVTPQQKTGRWIKQTLSVKPFGEDTVLCDQCGFMTAKDVETNYCPNCGAKMIKSQESEE